MSVGFNTKVRREDGVYHVQTEHHGPEHPFIDTVVVLDGQVLHRRNTSYADLVAGGTADLQALELRVAQQHRETVEALRAGRLPLEKPAAVSPRGGGPPIQVRLSNPGSWLRGQQASLEIHVTASGDNAPAAEADVSVRIEGAAEGEPYEFSARADAEGRALVRFPFPRLADTDAAALVIEARSSQGRDSVRYQVRRNPQASRLSGDE